MGTNYYRIPTEEEIISKKSVLIDDIKSMPVDANMIEREFSYLGAWDNEDDWERLNPWQKFVEGNSIHLGKRSSGWVFCWNFHDKKFYSDKKTLLEFIKAGRVVNEYGEEMEADEFIKMALEWGQPNGWNLETYYKENSGHRPYGYTPKEEYIDGLRISDSTDFS